MTEIFEDMLGLHLFCRFGRSEYLSELVRNRLPRFTSFVEEIAAHSGNTVLWTDQPGGHVTERKFILDATHCNELAAAVSQNEEFDFLAWTPWASRTTPSVLFVRNHLQGDAAVITITYPPHRHCEGLKYRDEIEFLTGVTFHEDMGFSATIPIRINNEKGPSAFKSFNMYYHTYGGRYPMGRVQRSQNSNLPEGEYVDPDTLFERVQRGEIM